MGNGCSVDGTVEKIDTSIDRATCLSQGKVWLDYPPPRGLDIPNNPRPAGLERWVETGERPLVDECKSYLIQYDGINEPPVQIWSDVGCRGSRVALYPQGSAAGRTGVGDKDLAGVTDLVAPRLGQRIASDGQVFGDNQADAMIIPGNMWVEGFSHTAFEQNNAEESKLSPLLRPYRRAVWGPGIHANLGNPNRGIGRDDLDSLIIHRTEDFSTFQVGCCTGQRDAQLCGKLSGPYDAACKNVMSKHCSVRGNFFSPECRQWVSGIPDQSRNQLARQVCSLPDLNDDEKQWCSCYITQDFPKEFEELPLASKAQLKALWPCMNATCNSDKALQPFQKDCPKITTICAQKDIRALLEDTSKVTNLTVQNSCGNIVLPEEPKPGPSGGSGPVEGGGLTSTQKAIALSILLAILLTLGFLVFAVLRK